MKYAELKDLTAAELTAKGGELRRELFNLRLQKASAQLEKTARLRTLRKDIARVETALTAVRRRPAPVA
jgi:large subunit ribosomal protein L29